MPLNFDFLYGGPKLRRQRDKAIDFAEAQYDPGIYQPMVDVSRERAVEGISEGQESIARQRTVESLFRPQDYSIYGGQQQRAIAGQQSRTRQQQQGLADFESRLTEADIQAQQQGQQQFAQARTQQRQTVAQREAATEEARLQYQAELDKRRQQFGSTIGQVAGIAAAAIPGVGPLAAGAIGAGAGGLLGGGGGVVQGGASGLTTGMQLQGEPPTEEQMQRQAMQTQAPNVPSERPIDTLLEDPLTQEQMTVDGQPQQRTVGSIFDQRITSDQARDVSTVGPFQQQTASTPPQRRPQPTVTAPSRESLLGDYQSQSQQRMISPVEQLTTPTQNIQQEMEELSRRGGDLTFEEFQRLEDLQRSFGVETQREVLGRVQQQARESGPSLEEIGGRFGNLFGNVSENTRALLDALGLTQEQRYQEFINQ